MCAKARGSAWQQLSAGARRWRSFFTSGSSALYLFLYSAFYFYTKLDITKARLPAWVVTDERFHMRM